MKSVCSDLIIILVCLFSTVACSGEGFTKDNSTSLGRSPAGNSANNFLNPTIYFQPIIKKDLSNCSSLRDLYSPEGTILETLCEADYKSCVVQGTCTVLANDKMTSYNFHSQKDGRSRFMLVDLKACPYVYGMRTTCLDPYFSVAADLSIYKLGDVIFIPKLVGVRMPNGEIHDGFLIVRDAGGGVVGSRRFDFYTGFVSYNSKANTLAQLGFGDPKSQIEFRMATPDEANSVRAQRNYPGLQKNTQNQ